MAWLDSCVVVFLLYLPVCLADNDILQDIFEVKPGGMVQEFKKTAFGTTCKFTYAAQGGTKEEWTAEVELLDNGTKVRCSMFRPGGSSYLFFQQFRLELIGGKLLQAYPESSGQRLEDKEFRVGANFVEQVDGVFRSQLSNVVAVSKISRVDL